MNQTKMPEPVAYAHRDILRRENTVERIHPTAKYGTESVALITTTQAEAYKDACVREAQQWVSVEDRLPGPEIDVLVKVDGKFGARTHDIAGLFRDEWMSQITEDIVRGCVTHWMPLPAPPQQ